MSELSVIGSKIFVIRDIQVMLDFDLAGLYGAETKALNQAVKRNIERFPSDFMFQLTDDEVQNLRSHFVTANLSMRRSNPYAFTQNGVAMLSSVLKSPKAIEVNIQIMRVFVSLRELSNDYSKHIAELYKMIREVDAKYDSKHSEIINYLQDLFQKGDSGELHQIGFIKQETK